ncbi:MAG: hypothetical protein JNL82_22590 [Myxococcales bacterium]|nr:hypothetical protein [Myxococcales bacterium]
MSKLHRQLSYLVACFAIAGCDPPDPPGPAPDPGDPPALRAAETCGYRTQNQYDWGADCDAAHPTACLRDKHYGQVLHDGLMLGCGVRTANLENSPGARVALPTSGKVRHLYLSESVGYDGVADPDVGTAFFGHVAALGMNLAFADLPAFDQNPGTPLGELLVADPDSPCVGMSVEDVFFEANAALGDCATSLTAQDLNTCVSQINAVFRDGTDLNGTPICTGKLVEPAPVS